MRILGRVPMCMDISHYITIPRNPLYWKNRFIQYLLVNKGKLWSLLFICPREISSKIEKEIGGIAETFRLEQEKPQ